MRRQGAVKRRRLTIEIVASRRAVTAALLVGCVVLVPARASAQRLTIQGDRFAVDDAPRFLTFISYFDGMEALDVEATPKKAREAAG